jgi:hypothetical protein
MSAGGSRSLPVSHSGSSDRTCRFPASGFRTDFTVFFDEDVPRKLARFLPGHEIQTVVSMQWGLAIGDL